MERHFILLFSHVFYAFGYSATGDIDPPHGAVGIEDLVRAVGEDEDVGVCGTGTVERGGPVGAGFLEMESYSLITVVGLG